MIDLFKSYLKKFFLGLVYENKLKNRPKKKFIKFSNKSPSVFVIVDSRLNMNLNDFKFIADIFLISDQSIRFLWYKSPILHDHLSHMRIDNFDISFTGKVSKDFDLFFDDKYDLLINVYKKNSIIMKTLSLKVKHDFSIGFTPVDSELNDIVFDFNPQNIKVFGDELSKYLKIISK